jgi:chaperonin GroES
MPALLTGYQLTLYMKKKKTNIRKISKTSVKKSAPRGGERSTAPNAFGLVPLGDKVLVRPLTEAEMGTKLPFGIIIPESASSKEKTDRGMIMAVGEGRRDDKGVMHAVEVKVGEKVLFQWGDKIEHAGNDYYLVSESNILAVIK